MEKKKRNGVGRKMYIYIQKNESGPLYYTIHNNQCKMPKWVKHLNVGLETVKPIEENMGESSLALVLRMISWT